MEADLQAVGVDYRDRWRGDLTLRRICVLVFRRPAEGGHVEFVRTGVKPFTRSEHILDETRRAVTVAVTHKVPEPWVGRFSRPNEERVQVERLTGVQADRMERRRRELEQQEG